jgi:hypothetical protein
VLRRHPLLTPFCQVRRWCRLLFGGRLRFTLRRRRARGQVTPEKTAASYALLTALGLISEDACPSGKDDTRDADIYLTFCTNHDYRKSKLYLSGKEQANAMNEHIPMAISAVIRALETQETAFSRTKMQKATLNRDSFIGALCSGDMKRRIEVDYCSFNRSHELRFLITDMIKYTENRLRTVFGMKSRLSIYGLPEQVKLALDDYLEKVLPSKRRIIVQERPAYEALYDAPITAVSPEHAQQIE